MIENVPARPRVIPSDNVLLCQLSGVILLGFSDAFQPPSKTLENSALLAGELALLKQQVSTRMLPLWPKHGLSERHRIHGCCGHHYRSLNRQ